MTMSLADWKRQAEQVRLAADIIEEAAALYGFAHPEHVAWSPHELRAEAEHMETGDL